MPAAPNSGLAPGRWRSADHFLVEVWSRSAGPTLADEHVDTVPILVDLHLRPAEETASFDALNTEWTSAALVNDPPSGMYYHAFVSSVQIEPKGRVWWGTAGEHSTLHLQVVLTLTLTLTLSLSLSLTLTLTLTLTLSLTLSLTRWSIRPSQALPWPTCTCARTTTPASTTS